MAVSARRKKRNSGLLPVAVVVGIMIAVILYRSYSLRQQLNDSLEKETKVASELQTEQERTKEIEDYETYTKTDQFVEETAKEKLGLVYDGETIFKNEDNQ